MKTKALLLLLLSVLLIQRTEPETDPNLTQA